MRAMNESSQTASLPQVKPKKNRQDKPYPGLKKRTAEMLWAYLFVAPALLCLAIFHLLPAGASMVFSLTDWNGLTMPEFIGLDNFRAIGSDADFLRAVGNTLYYAAVTIPVSIVLATVLAVGLNQQLRGRSFYRTVYFLPVVTMTTAVSLIWRWLLNSEFGPVNYVLGLLHLPQPHWVTDPAFAMLSIIIVSVWSSVGYHMIILLAGLQGISPSYYEAAAIDGASAGYRFFRITLPLLTPSLFFVLMIALIQSLQVFDLVFVMTGGVSTSGPNPVLLQATRTVVYNMYDEGFVLFHMGYASAQAVVLFAAVLLMTVIQFYLQKKWVHYQ